MKKQKEFILVLARRFLREINRNRGGRRFFIFIEKVYRDIRYNNVRFYGKTLLMTYICKLFRIVLNKL